MRSAFLRPRLSFEQVAFLGQTACNPRMPMLRQPKRSTWSRAVALTAATAGLVPAPCAARDDGPFIYGRLSLGLGLFFGYQSADQASGRSGFEWGFEAYATERYGDVGTCSGGARSGFGPIVQLGIKGVEDPRLTVAVRAGAELDRAALAFTGELGASYRFGRDPGPSLHLGVMPELWFFSTGLRHQLFRNETWVGGGLRYLPTFGEQGFCSEGRPLRLENAKCIDSGAQSIAAGSDAALAAAAFAADAQMECISISAFLQLAEELIAASAPDALVQRALAAANDELRHTLQCSAMAQSLARVTTSCVLPAVSLRSFDSRQTLLERIAQESYEDGCVGEGVAAHRLTRAAELAADRGIARHLGAIARDEASHAELAWDVLQFCVDAGGAPVRAALRDCMTRVRRQHWSGEAAPELTRFGRIQPRELAQLARDQVARCDARALRIAS